MKNSTKTRKVLAIGAHPDDIEISCAGTLAKFHKQGVHVSILSVMNGDKGSYDIPPAKLAGIRGQECRNAASVINADWTSFGIPDGTVVWDIKLHERMIQEIQRIDPDIIITHSPEDYMSDHTETAKAVINASFYTVCPQFCQEDSVPSGKVVPIYFMDTMCGIRFAPQEYVDITDTFAIKQEMYAKHESQHKYLNEREGVDFSNIISVVAQYRGLQCGKKYAEAFSLYEVWPRITTERLLP